MKVYIHVGYPKCGSTSLQTAIRDGTGVLYPQAGTRAPDAEHISLPLYIRGIDEWTQQFISEEWVQIQHQLMMQEIARSDRPVFISSERLSGLDAKEVQTLRDIFSGHDTEIIIVVRDREKYLDSTWRHAVFHHDFAASYPDFLKLMEDFQFEIIVPKFKKYFPVNIFNLEDKDFENDIKGLIGANFNLGFANTGVPHILAKLLQEQHALIGSRLFKDLFPMENKTKMLFMATHQERVAIDPFCDPIF